MNYLKSVEKEVKRFIKGKISLNLATMVVFLMTGFFAFSAEATTDSGENSKTLRERVSALETRVDNLVDATNKTNNNAALDTKLDKTEAETTYAKKTDLDTKLDKTEAEATYAKKTDLDTKLDKTEAEGKYVTKEDYEKLKTAHTQFVEDITNYNVANDAWGRDVDTFMSDVDTSLTEAEAAIETLKTEKLDKTEAETTYAKKTDLDTKLDTEKFNEFTTKLKEAMTPTLAAIEKLGEGMVELTNELDKKATKESLEEEKTARETKDTELEGKIDTKLDTEKFNEFTTKLEQAMTPTLAAIGELGKGMIELSENKADKDATNIDVDKFVAKLTEGAKFDDSATGKRLATDSDVVDVIKTSETRIKIVTDGLDNRIDNLEMANGTAEGLEKIKEIKNVIDEKATIEALNQEIANREAADTEIKEELAKKATTEALNQEIANRETADKAINVELSKKINADKVYTKEESDARFARIDSTISNNDAKTMEAINTLKNETNSGISTVAALSGLNPLSYDVNRPTHLMASIGTYNGNQSLAVGLAHYFTKDFVISSGGAFAFDTKSLAGNVGISYKFGSSNVETESEKIEKLEKEIQLLKEAIEKLTK